MKQKHYWEIRIRELGGNVASGRQIYDIEGKELVGAPGYRYYGAAKDLPGVRELFQEQDAESQKPTENIKRYEKMYFHFKVDITNCI